MCQCLWKNFFPPSEPRRQAVIVAWQRWCGHHVLRQAGHQVGQHGGTNRGLGGERGCSHLERGSPTRRRRRDVSGEKGHLGVKFVQGFPGSICSLSSIICFRNTWGSWGGVWHFFFWSVQSKHPFPVNWKSLSTKRFLSGADRKGRLFHCRGCPLKDPDRPRGASGVSLILDTWTPSPSSFPCSPPHTHTPETPLRPPGVGYQLWVFVGVCASIVSVNSRTIHPPNSPPAPSLPIRVNTFPSLPPHTHS